MQHSPQAGTAKRCWRIAFVAYAVLSISSMAGMSIGLGMFAAASIWYFSSDWRGRGREALREAFSTPYTWLSMALFLASLLSLLAAFAFPVEGSQAGPMLSSLKKYHYYLFPPLFAAALIHTSDSLERHPFWKAWAIFGGILGVIAMLQFFAANIFPYGWLGNSFFRPVGQTGRYHGQGLMFFHLSFASSMCFVASSAWARLVFPLRGDAPKEKVFWAASALLSTAGVYFSYSRIAFAALAIVVLVLGFLRKPLYGIFSAIFVGISGFLLWTFSPSLQHRFLDFASGTKERETMWRAAVAMVEQRPLTGVGFSRTGELSPWFVAHVLKQPLEFTSHAHNNFLDMLAATGLIGFAAFLAWWGFLFFASWRSFRLAPEGKKWLPAATLTGFLAFHVNGLTQVNYWDGKSEHALMLWTGVAVALWIRDSHAKHQ
jgi:O-antigen ligase